MRGGRPQTPAKGTKTREAGSSAWALPSPKGFCDVKRKSTSAGDRYGRKGPEGVEPINRHLKMALSRLSYGPVYSGIPSPPYTHLLTYGLYAHPAESYREAGVMSPGRDRT